MKETDALAFPAVADTLVGALGVPPPRDACEPRIGTCYPPTCERKYLTITRPEPPAAPGPADA